jgi:PD-(D/E)XK nuclease superfamily
MDRIRIPADQRLAWPDTTRHSLNRRLHDDLADAADRIPADASMWVGKADLDAVHGCEARHLASSFAWSVATARGRVTHKAIELTISNRGDPEPRDLVEDALGRLTEDDTKLADFLQTCGTAARADLTAQAVTVVDGFLTTFPPLTRGFRPAAETARRWELYDGRITLGGRFDLTVGVPDGCTAGRAIVEIKTGGTLAGHRDDLRFYALLESLVVGVPPMSLVVHYPERGQADVEVVTEQVLESAVRRTVAGVRRLVELRLADPPAEPVRRPGPPCRWCPISVDCTPGRAWLAGEDAEDW